MDIVQDSVSPSQTPPSALVDYHKANNPPSMQQVWAASDPSSAQTHAATNLGTIGISHANHSSMQSKPSQTSNFSNSLQPGKDGPKKAATVPKQNVSQSGAAVGHTSYNHNSNSHTPAEQDTHAMQMDAQHHHTAGGTNFQSAPLILLAPGQAVASSYQQQQAAQSQQAHAAGNNIKHTNSGTGLRHRSSGPGNAVSNTSSGHAHSHSGKHHHQQPQQQQQQPQQQHVQAAATLTGMFSGGQGPDVMMTQSPPPPIPRRALTKPFEGVKNDGFDNENCDLVLYSGDVLVHQNPSTGVMRSYLIQSMLGQGTFGQVVSCWDDTAQRTVAVKVIKNQPAYFHQARVEIGLLHLLNTRCDPHDERHIVRMIDSFLFRKHLCIVFEKLDVNLFELLKRNAFKGLSLSTVQILLRQLLDALMVLHDSSIMHCDLKPENILLKSQGSDQIKLIDFGSACFENRVVYSYIQSRFYRSPEVVLGTAYNVAIDMWSLGCVAAELFLGLPLFPGASEHDLMVRIVDTLGLPPAWLLGEAKHTERYFKKITLIPTPTGTSALPFTSPSMLASSLSNSGGLGPYDLASSVSKHQHQHLAQLAATAQQRSVAMGSTPGNAGNNSQPTNTWVLLSQAEFEARNNCRAPSGKRYFMHTKLADIIAAYPMKHGLQDDEIQAERLAREAFIDFLLGVLDLDPKSRWTPRQAVAHPFITGALFTGPFQPPQDERTPRAAGSTISPPSSSRASQPVDAMPVQYNTPQTVTAAAGQAAGGYGAGVASANPFQTISNPSSGMYIGGGQGNAGNAQQQGFGGMPGLPQPSFPGSLQTSFILGTPHKRAALAPQASPAARQAVAPQPQTTSQQTVSIPLGTSFMGTPTASTLQFGFGNFNQGANHAGSASASKVTHRSSNQGNRQQQGQQMGVSGQAFAGASSARYSLPQQSMQATAQQQHHHHQQQVSTGVSMDALRQAATLLQHVPGSDMSSLLQGLQAGQAGGFSGLAGGNFGLQGNVSQAATNARALAATLQQMQGMSGTTQLGQQQLNLAVLIAQQAAAAAASQVASDNANNAMQVDQPTYQGTLAAAGLINPWAALQANQQSNQSQQQASMGMAGQSQSQSGPGVTSMILGSQPGTPDPTTGAAQTNAMPAGTAAFRLQQPTQVNAAVPQGLTALLQQQQDAQQHSQQQQFSLQQAMALQSGMMQPDQLQQVANMAALAALKQAQQALFQQQQHLLQQQQFKEQQQQQQQQLALAAIAAGIPMQNFGLPMHVGMSTSTANSAFSNQATQHANTSAFATGRTSGGVPQQGTVQGWPQHAQQQKAQQRREESREAGMGSGSHNHHQQQQQQGLGSQHTSQGSQFHTADEETAGQALLKLVQGPTTTTAYQPLQPLLQQGAQEGSNLNVLLQSGGSGGAMQGVFQATSGVSGDAPSSSLGGAAVTGHDGSRASPIADWDPGYADIDIAEDGGNGATSANTAGTTGAQHHQTQRTHSGAGGGGATGRPPRSPSQGSGGGGGDAGSGPAATAPQTRGTTSTHEGGNKLAAGLRQGLAQGGNLQTNGSAGMPSFSNFLSLTATAQEQQQGQKQPGVDKAAGALQSSLLQNALFTNNNSGINLPVAPAGAGMTGLGQASNFNNTQGGNMMSAPAFPRLIGNAFPWPENAAPYQSHLGQQLMQSANGFGNAGTMSNGNAGALAGAQQGVADQEQVALFSQQGQAAMESFNVGSLPFSGMGPAPAMHFLDVIQQYQHEFKQQQQQLQQQSMDSS